MSVRDLSAQLADHVMELGYRLTMVQLGRGGTAAALAEIDVLAGKLSQLREQLGGQAVPVDEQPAQRQGQEIAELLAVLWHLCDEGQLPAALDSLLLGEYHHLRPVRADRPDMLGDVRALADQVDW